MKRVLAKSLFALISWIRSDSSRMMNLKFNNHKKSIIKKNICSTSSGGSTTFIAEPYAYREYFDSQGYIPSRTTAIYSEPETPTTASLGYEGRYTTSHPKASSIYAKTITSAGLTVDLPSPDSGIGAESITPRDQNNIQQVNGCKKSSF